jgi:hypothetical protein
MDVMEPVQVVVEMEPTGKTISGRISVEDAPPCGFFGWLELIDCLERAASERAVARAGRKPLIEGVEDERAHTRSGFVTS